MSDGIRVRVGMEREVGVWLAVEVGKRNKSQNWGHELERGGVSEVK